MPQGVDLPATNTCEILDLGEASPSWAPAPPMAEPRVMPDSVLLPDGTVLVTKGSSTGFVDTGANPVYLTELCGPETETWSSVCPMRIPRLYHSIAMLLPDAWVLTAGTDGEFNPHPFHTANFRVEILSSPYFFVACGPAS